MKLVVYDTTQYFLEYNPVTKEVVEKYEGYKIIENKEGAMFIVFINNKYNILFETCFVVPKIFKDLNYLIHIFNTIRLEDIIKEFSNQVFSKQDADKIYMNPYNYIRIGCGLNLTKNQFYKLITQKKAH